MGAPPPPMGPPPIPPEIQAKLQGLQRITDAIKLGNSIKAIDLLLGKDSNSMRYLKYFRSTEKLREQEAAVRVQ